MKVVLKDKAVGKWAAFFHTDAGPEVSAPSSLPIRARLFIWFLYVFVFGVFIAAVVVYALTTNVSSTSFSSFDDVSSCVTSQYYNSRYSGTVSYNDAVTVESSSSDPAFGTPATRVFWSVEFYSRKALVDLTATLQEPPLVTSDGHNWAETITEYVTGHAATEMYALYQPSTLIVLATWTSTLPTSLTEPVPQPSKLFNYYDPSSGQTRTSYCYNYGYHEFSNSQTNVYMNYDNTQTNLYPCNVAVRNATYRGWTPNQMKELRRVLFNGISDVLNSQLFPRECLATEPLSVSQIISLALSIAAFAVTVARYAMKVAIRALKLQPWFMPSSVQAVSLVGPANAAGVPSSPPPTAIDAWGKKADAHEMPSGYRHNQSAAQPSPAPHPDIPQAGDYHV